MSIYYSLFLCHVDAHVYNDIMTTLRFNNTIKKGSYTLLAFKEEGNFTGVCLEFGLIVQRKTLEKALETIKDYATAWLKNAQKNKLPNEVLNRPAPQKYWTVFRLYTNYLSKRKEKTQITKPSILQSSLQSSFFNYNFN